jgi:hypothetical protein
LRSQPEAPAVPQSGNVEPFPSAGVVAVLSFQEIFFPEGLDFDACLRLGG